MIVLWVRGGVADVGSERRVHVLRNTAYEIAHSGIGGEGCPRCRLSHFSDRKHETNERSNLWSIPYVLLSPLPKIYFHPRLFPSKDALALCDVISGDVYVRPGLLDKPKEYSPSKDAWLHGG